MHKHFSHYILKFGLHARQVLLTQRQKIAILDRLDGERSLKRPTYLLHCVLGLLADLIIHMVSFLRHEVGLVEEVYFSKVEARFYYQVGQLIKLLRHERGLAFGEKINFFNRVSFSVNKILVLYSEWFQKRPNEGDKIGRFISEEEDLFDDFLIHQQRQFYSKVLRELIQNLKMFRRVFAIVIFQSAFESSIQIKTQSVLPFYLIQSPHSLSQLCRSRIQRRKH
ncbi:hypothetical protein FGO68_gene231 [Halteria grandinella]|uniref:Uncharacterized protein n=1 Tax=Halteria grandinella TaxID=5974 RepID=A0A8J8P1C4_HALGN|nr:hypothetical protein FGO68_gene231 [Halteria grandinella]